MAVEGPQSTTDSACYSLIIQKDLSYTIDGGLSVVNSGQKWCGGGE